MLLSLVRGFSHSGQPRCGRPATGNYKYFILSLSMVEGNQSSRLLDVDQNQRRYLRSQLAGYLLTNASLWCIKFSFLAFFRKLGNRYRLQRITWWGMLAFLAITLGATLGVLDYRCEVSNSIFDSIGMPLHDPRPYYD